VPGPMDVTAACFARSCHEGKDRPQVRTRSVRSGAFHLRSIYEPGFRNAAPAVRRSRYARWDRTRLDGGNPEDVHIRRSAASAPDIASAATATDR
jgi:hypothetical protein